MKVLYTSALISQKSEERKSHYKDSYYSLLDYIKKEDIFIVECFSENVDFLSELGSPVYTANTHNPSIKNKGVLELSALKKFMATVEFTDDILLKITGRYRLLDNSFLNAIEQNSGYDFYGKLVDNNTQVFTGCFAIKDSILKEFLEYVNLEFLEKNMINIEKVLLDFLIEKNKKCFFVEKINIFAPIFGIGNIDNNYL